MKKLPDERLYLVFVHYGLKQPEDWDWIGGRLTLKCNTVVPRLADDVRYLRRVLRPRKTRGGQLWKGFAFIFLDPGWTDLLRGGAPIHSAKLAADLAAAQREIEERLERNISQRADLKRERIVTAGNLVYLLDLLDKAARDRGESFSQLFVGEAQSLQYDAPKVIEAAIRIANLGCGIPLFRFDDDVIFYGQRSPKAKKEKRDSAANAVAANILRLCKRHQTILKDPLIRYFVYSGGYDGPESGQEVATCTANDPRLLNGFATRVLQLTQLPAHRNRDTEDTTEGVIQQAVVKAFLKQLVELGANSFRQVVSGAGLCLSDGAILDLPPYSNMHLNVLWIDDHLKYALHDELGHFGRWTRTHHHYVARVSEARFNQLRHFRKKKAEPLFTYRDVKWHLRTYMLRLLLGCVADSWLRKIPAVKEATHSLGAAAYNRLAKSVPHFYGASFMEVLPGGWEPSEGKPTVDQFRQKLWKQGCERLRRIVDLWSDGTYGRTFLGVFVQGSTHSRYEEFKDFLPGGMSEGLAKAVDGLRAQYQNAQRPPPSGGPDEPSLEQALVTLVDDFVQYMSLVQFWPFFVQSVRCFQNQHAQYHRADLEWMFPSGERST